MSEEQAILILKEITVSCLKEAEDMQEEIRKAINKQFAIGIDTGEGFSISGQSIKNTRMFKGH